MAAAASPAASRAGTVAQNSPRTPRNVGSRGWAESAALDAVTPLRKVPILANFEEMMKMATDNVSGAPGISGWFSSRGAIRMRIGGNQGADCDVVENQCRKLLEFCINRLLP